MDIYLQSVLIIGIVVFVKVMVIVCIYGCRARRQSQSHGLTDDSTAYPPEPHSMRSAIVNFEETPQPIISVTPGTDPSSLNPLFSPPPYSMVGGKADKPPCYEQVIGHGERPPPDVQYAEPATSSAIPTANEDIPPPAYSQEDMAAGQAGVHGATGNVGENLIVMTSTGNDSVTSPSDSA